MVDIWVGGWDAAGATCSVERREHVSEITRPPILVCSLMSLWQPINVCVSLCVWCTAAVQVDQWQHRRMPDPRLVMDGEDRLPCQVAMRRQHNEVARMLLPSTPLSSLFADGELTVLGPASLAEIAGTVLRQTMERELQNIQQTMGSAGLLPGQEPSSAAAAADAIVSVPAGDPGHERQLQQDCGDRPNTAQCKPFGGLQDLQGATTATVAVGEQPAGGAAWNSTTCRQVSSCASEEVCGVCFEARPCVALEPCKHQLCIPCCAHLLEMHSRCVLMCPFCR